MRNYYSHEYQFDQHQRLQAASPAEQLDIANENFAAADHIRSVCEQLPRVDPIRTAEADFLDVNREWATASLGAVMWFSQGLESALHGSILHVLRERAGIADNQPAPALVLDETDGLTLGKLITKARELGAVREHVLRQLDPPASGGAPPHGPLQLRNRYHHQYVRMNLEAARAGDLDADNLETENLAASKRLRRALVIVSLNDERHPFMG